MLRSGRFLLTAAGVVLAVVLLGVWWYFSDGQRANRAHDGAFARWEAREPAAYTFDFTYCSGMCDACRLEVTVRDDVASADEWHGSCPFADTRPPTIEDVFALENHDRARELPDFDIRYDPYWGFPAWVDIRCGEGVLDCGTGYEVTGFEALP